MTTHAETRRLNETYPSGTIVEFLDVNGALRVGRSDGAEGGELRLLSPVPPTKKHHGITPARWRDLSQLHRVSQESIRKVLP